MKEGKGDFFYANGNYYTGNWRKDEKHGIIKA